MTEFLIIVAVVDLLVFVALYSVMKAGRAHDRASESQARAIWANSERVRHETPVASPRAPGIAGRKVFDSHGSLLGSSGELLLDPLDGAARWLEVQVRGLGSTRNALVPADGLSVSMTEIRTTVSREHTLRAPIVFAGALTRESEIALCRHYGLSRRAAELRSRGSGEPTAVASAQLQSASVA